jgi:uncharacterized protein (DUF3084 family)
MSQGFAESDHNKAQAELDQMNKLLEQLNVQLDTFDQPRHIVTIEDEINAESCRQLDGTTVKLHDLSQNIAKAKKHLAGLHEKETKLKNDVDRLERQCTRANLR